MLRRIAPLLLALAVAGAPVALELCHIACASLSRQPDAPAGAHAHASHSCHDAGESRAPVSLHAHPCDHGDDLQAPAGIGSPRQSNVGASVGAVIWLTGSLAGTPLNTRTRVQPWSSGRSPARADRMLPLRI